MTAVALKEPTQSRSWAVPVGLALICLVLSVASLGMGTADIGIGDAFGLLTGSTDSATASIMLTFLAPRILLCWLVGIALAVSGAVLQGVIRNPLAAPDIIGVTKGAGLGAMLMLLLFPAATAGMIPVGAFAGGVLAALLVYAFAYRSGTSAIRLALVGIAISALCEAGIRFLIVRNPPDINAALIWLTGSVFGRSMSDVWQFLPWVLVLVPMVVFYARRLDVLGLGDDLAAGLGEPVERTRRIVLLLAVALASSAVAVAGTVGFVGLIAPHMARRLVGGRALTLLPSAAMIGAALMLVSDSIGRVVLQPLEIPVGLVTAVIGGPYFLYLLARTAKTTTSGK
ncbi:FecCD family ABC transporter permease [Nakamurella lactea]|uniref:FecCD family ABC transporter permease n=1 Tax=Nakamurella lactea TaxID=459515 RepID=UPI00041514BB|nr:iron ABC transporter permease [Nakamurella lactea]